MFSTVGRYSPRCWSYKSLLQRSLHNGKLAILGIESSCDDSCAAIVTENGTILSSIQKAQHAQNQALRGVVPSVASKSHEMNLPIVVNECIHHCGGELFISQLDAVAVTIGPGLAPCLGVGLRFAKNFCRKYSKPLILVNHMEAHAMAATMHNQVFYPAFGFMVSGGNTEIVYIPDHLHPFLKVGDTLDDACGECMDKVYRCILDILHPEAKPIVNVECISQYPIHHDSSLKHGGAQISIWSKQYESTEEWLQGGKRIPFPLPMSRHHNANFSFSGIKTYAIRYLQKMQQKGEVDLLSIQRFCHYFEHTLVKHLLKKVAFSLDLFPEVRYICCGGGVMSNQLLQNSLRELGKNRGIEVVIPPKAECTDNAIMIAWRGIQLYKAGRRIVDKDQIELVRYDDRLDFSSFPSS